MIIFLSFEAFQEKVAKLTEEELEHWVQSYTPQMTKELRNTFVILLYETKKHNNSSLLRQRLAAYLYGTQVI